MKQFKEWTLDILKVLFSMSTIFVIAGLVIWQATGAEKGQKMTEEIKKAPSAVASSEAPEVKAIITGEKEPPKFLRGDEGSLGKVCERKIIHQLNARIDKGAEITESLVAEKLEKCYRMSLEFENMEF